MAMVLDTHFALHNQRTINLGSKVVSQVVSSHPLASRIQNADLVQVGEGAEAGGDGREAGGGGGEARRHRKVGLRLDQEGHRSSLALETIMVIRSWLLWSKRLLRLPQNCCLSN